MGLLRSNEIFSDATLNVIAVESLSVECQRTRAVHTIVGNLAPLAVIVCTPDAITAIDMEAQPADLARLRRDVPGLNAMIATYEHARTDESENDGDAR